MLYPILFQPIFKERIWGGRLLETLYQKPLPPGVPVGESWEISDRPNDNSVVANGPLAGKTLRWLMETYGPEIFGKNTIVPPVFPLLVKILDAQQDLSLQVHPPAAKAAELKGDPKTEMWYFTSTTPAAQLYVGLRQGVTREEFERRTADGSVADCFHKIQVRAGDSMFLPSGRVHALGAGSVLFEIQQNSDTTYRVFDWNRVDASGKPRDLHIPQSLASIDFTDFEPDLIRTPFEAAGPLRLRPLVEDPFFHVRVCELAAESSIALPLVSFQILGLVSGELRVKGGSHELLLKPGQFGLLPASLRVVEVKATKDAQFLQVTAGKG
jgi:mannose-6-phosphate isomerase